MQHKKLEDYIYIVKNALSLNLCNEILNEFKSSDEWQDTVVGSGIVEKGIRNCETIVISFPYVIKKNSEVRHK
jgi:hypothetical protein